jgi:hypothetical protein
MALTTHKTLFYPWLLILIVHTAGHFAEAMRLAVADLAPSAFGDLDQHPVGGGKVVWVKAGIHASGDGADGLGQPGVEGGTLGGELDRPGAVDGAAGDQAPGFEAVQELGDLGAIEPQLRLAGEVVVQFGG